MSEVRELLQITLVLGQFARNGQRARLAHDQMGLDIAAFTQVLEETPRVNCAGRSRHGNNHASRFHPAKNIMAAMDAIDLGPVWLSLNLAGLTVVILIILATPVAWWLANTQSRSRSVIAAIVAVPLVLPPTVLGFYLLLLLGPSGPVGAFWLSITDSTLTFSFTGLVIASVIYSLPFAVQPLQTAFESVGRRPVEAAATLGLGPLDTFWRVVMPLAKQGYLAAAALSFAHTLGEFGVVLMVGGNIPGETRVISIAIFEDVETLNYFEAHVLSAGLLVFAFVILIALFSMNAHSPLRSAAR